MHRKAGFLAAVLNAMLAVSAFASSPAIERVEVTPAYANPSAGVDFEIVVKTNAAGRLLVQVVDRDGFLVRTLGSSESANGLNRYVWNGRGEDGSIVADEAYSLRIVFTDGKRNETYFPAEHAAPMASIPVKSFSPATGALVYDLPKPSRVHLQAGVATQNKRTKELEGPVLKTIVNREPRAAGRIAEQWNGLDESGRIYIPDLANFVVAIAATPLPENSLIVVGNRKTTFLDQATLRKGTSFLVAHQGPHAHHAGLTAIEDVSPPLSIEPLNAVWSEKEGVWTMTSTGALRLRLNVTGPAATAFAAQPATLHRFANYRPVRESALSGSSPVIEIGADRLDQPVNVVSVNWQSHYGGVAANSIRVRRPSRSAAARIATP